MYAFLMSDVYLPPVSSAVRQKKALTDRALSPESRRILDTEVCPMLFELIQGSRLASMAPPPAARCPKAAALRERNKKIIEAREYKKLASDVSVTSADQRRLGINQLDLQSGKKIFSVVFSILATMAASFAFGFYVSTSLTPNMGALFCTRRCVQRGVFCFRAGADACSSLCRRARVLRLSQLYASCLGFSVRWLPRVPSSTL